MACMLQRDGHVLYELYFIIATDRYHLVHCGIGHGRPHYLIDVRHMHMHGKCIGKGTQSMLGVCYVVLNFSQ